LDKEIKFWLLDLNWGTLDRQRCMFLWGIDDRGRRVLLLDEQFEPSLYLVLAGDVQLEPIAGQLKRLATEHELGADISVEEKRQLGRRVQAVRVRYSDNSKAERFAADALRLKGVKSVHELDLRPSTLYLLDTQATPCRWHRVKVSETDGSAGYAVPSAYLVRGEFRPEGDLSPPPLRLLAFHAIYKPSKGSPDPKKDPVAVISVKTEGSARSFVLDGSDDSGILNGFVTLVRREDPDVVVGFRSNSRDWLHLVSRADALDLGLNVSRAMTKPHPSVHGHFSITGRLAIDLADLADDMPELETKTLEALAEYLGSAPKEGFIPLEEVTMSRYWETEQGIGDLRRASEQRAQAAYDVCSEALDYLLELSSLTKLPADHVLAAPVGFRVDSYLMLKAKRSGEVVPPIEEGPDYTYAGGLVMAPIPGMHELVAVVDFRSMYPNIMISFNVSPETMVRTSRPSEEVNISPEGGYRFFKEPRGFFPSALIELIEERQRIEAQLKSARSGPEKRVLMAREKAVKVISNAVYGYTGWLGARWYSKGVAESTTAWGRSLITKASNLAEELGLKVVYGDTDSLFISYDADNVRKLLTDIGQELKFEARVDKVYERVIFTEAKKRYAGITSDGAVDIVGLEAVRSDWSEVARRTQREVLNDLLSGRGLEAARADLDKMIDDIRSGRVPLQDFVIWKVMSRPLSKYKVRAPHVEAARVLEEKGWTIKPGDRVGYLVVRATRNKPHVMPYQLASAEDIDVEYYVNEQVLPACTRVIEAAKIKG